MSVISLKHMCLVDSFQFSKTSKEAGYLFSARFTLDGHFMIAGGAGRNEIKVFANDADTTKSYQ